MHVIAISTIRDYFINYYRVLYTQMIQLRYLILARLTRLVWRLVIIMPKGYLVFFGSGRPVMPSPSVLGRSLLDTSSTLSTSIMAPMTVLTLSSKRTGILGGQLSSRGRIILFTIRAELDGHCMRKRRRPKVSMNEW